MSSDTQFSELKKTSLELSRSLPSEVYNQKMGDFLAGYHWSPVPVDLDSIVGFVKCPQCSEIEVTYYVSYPQALSCSCKQTHDAQNISPEPTVTIPVSDLEVWAMTLNTISHGFDLGKTEQSEAMIQKLIEEMESLIPPPKQKSE
jgi:hypothetical protein